MTVAVHGFVTCGFAESAENEGDPPHHCTEAAAALALAGEIAYDAWVPACEHHAEGRVLRQRGGG